MDVALLAALLLVSLAGCAGNLVSNPPVYQWHKEMVQAGNTEFHVTLAKPASKSARPMLVVFASASRGLMGGSKAILQHLADQGFYLAGVSSREATKQTQGSGVRTPYGNGWEILSAVVAQARRAFDLPADTPTILTGMSLGAGMVVGAAGDPRLRDNLAGVVAIALIDAGSYRTIAEEPTRLPMPVAIIQSTDDEYLPAAESRRLLGADTPTRRLYSVEAGNHAFGGGREALMRDLDDAMKWLVAAHRPM